MKQPDEWRTRVDRWYPTIIGVFTLTMTVLYALAGASLWLLIFMVFVTLFSFAIQLEYELKVGVLS